MGLYSVDVYTRGVIFGMLIVLDIWEAYILVRIEAYKRGSVLTVFYSILMKGRPIVAGRVFRTSAISEVLYCIIEFALSLIPHIFKDSFDFLQRLEKQSENNMLISACDTNSLHILEYWI